MLLVNDRKLMIQIIVVLLLAKFVIVPVLEWQNEQIDIVNRQSKQLNKGLKLLENKSELVEHLGKLRSELQVQSQLIAGKGESAISYQLNVQKQIEALLEKYELTSRSITWLNPAVKGNTEEHKLELQLKGSLKNFISLIMEIEQQKPKLAVVEYKSNVSKMYPQRQKLGQFLGKLVIVGWRDISGSTDE